MDKVFQPRQQTNFIFLVLLALSSIAGYAQSSYEVIWERSAQFESLHGVKLNDSVFAITANNTDYSNAQGCFSGIYTVDKSFAILDSIFLPQQAGFCKTVRGIEALNGQFVIWGEETNGFSPSVFRSFIHWYDSTLTLTGSWVDSTLPEHYFTQLSYDSALNTYWMSGSIKETSGYKPAVFKLVSDSISVFTTSTYPGLGVFFGMVPASDSVFVLSRFQVVTYFNKNSGAFFKETFYYYSVPDTSFTLNYFRFPVQHQGRWIAIGNGSEYQPGLPLAHLKPSLVSYDGLNDTVESQFFGPLGASNIGAFRNLAVDFKGRLMASSNRNLIYQSDPFFGENHLWFYRFDENYNLIFSDKYGAPGNYRTYWMADFFDGQTIISSGRRAKINGTFEPKFKAHFLILDSAATQPGLAVEDHSFVQDLHIYPNPTRTTFRISGWPDGFQGVLTITSLAGVALMREKVHQNKTYLVDGFPPGVYLVRVVSNDGKIFRGRLLKN